MLLDDFDPVGPLDEHPARIETEQLLKVCSVHFGRASGPGGQHRNKVETAVRIKHEPTGIEATATETRSQSRNRTEATFRLRVKLAVEIDWLPSEGPIPSELWSRRCVNRKIVCNPQHDDAPALLAEALLVCRLTGYDLKVAAETLECSSSQLLKFLAQFPSAREKIQREREQRGLHRLKF